MNKVYVVSYINSGYETIMIKVFATRDAAELFVNTQTDFGNYAIDEWEIMQ